MACSVYPCVVHSTIHRSLPSTCAGGPGCSSELAVLYGALGQCALAIDTSSSLPRLSSCVRAVLQACSAASFNTPAPALPLRPHTRGCSVPGGHARPLTHTRTCTIPPSHVFIENGPYTFAQHTHACSRPRMHSLTHWLAHSQISHVWFTENGPYTFVKGSKSELVETEFGWV